MRHGIFQRTSTIGLPRFACCVTDRVLTPVRYTDVHIQYSTGRKAQDFTNLLPYRPTPGLLPSAGLSLLPTLGLAPPACSGRFCNGDNSGQRSSKSMISSERSVAKRRNAGLSICAVCFMVFWVLIRGAAATFGAGYTRGLDLSGPCGATAGAFFIGTGVLLAVGAPAWRRGRADVGRARTFGAGWGTLFRGRRVGGGRMGAGVGLAVTVLSTFTDFAGIRKRM